MSINLSALATNADKLDKYINENEKQDRKDKQLYCIIERKVKKAEHKRERPRSRDGTLKECKRLFEEGASPEVLTKLEESLREQEKYHRYYVQCFLPVLGEAIERSKKISDETKEQAISEITKGCFNNGHKSSESESGYGSDFEDEVNGNDVQLLNAIKNGNNRKFRKYLKDCANVSGITDEKGNNILHLIASLEKKQKCKFLGTLIKTVTRKNLVQLIDSENQKGKTPFQVALINKVAKEKHSSYKIQSDDNTLKFLVKLLDYGAKLSLTKEDLSKLSQKQNEYYCKFLEKLAERRPETKTKVKEVIAHAINTSNSNGDYPLHLAIKNKDEKSFKELLQKGASISLKGANDNNALHLIVTKLKKEQKLEFLNIVLNISEKEQLKAQLKEAINAENTAKQTPFHQLFQHIKEKNEDRSCTDKKFKKTNRYKVLELFLQNGADITTQDKEGNNILHHIALLKGEQKIACLELISDKDRFSNAVNTTNRERLTPLHHLFQHIKEKNEDRSCTDKKFKKTNRYKALELFLQNGADITTQDKEGNNILHHIALLKGEQKIACLELILALVEKGVISKDKLDKAAKVTNERSNTPLELALKKKAMKEKIECLSPLQKITVSSPIIDNTTKFCAKLLEVGADSRSLKLEEGFHTKKYYRALLNLENYSETPQEGKVKAKELRKKLEKKYNVRTFSKECQRILHKTGNGFKAAWKCIDPGRRASILLAITVATTIITMVTLSCFQGQIAIGAALPIIAITGIVCLIVTLGLSSIRKSVKELTNNEQGVPNGKSNSYQIAEQDKISNSATKQNLENEHKDLEKQELQQRPLDQPSESPDTKMYDLSIMSLRFQRHALE